jgi:hypothetical protein
LLSFGESPGEEHTGGGAAQGTRGSADQSYGAASNGTDEIAARFDRIAQTRLGGCGRSR